MIRYIIKRILMTVLVMIGVTLFVFTINRASGDPIPILLGTGYTQEQYDVLEEQMGLDKPYVVQYFNYVKGIVTRFDLGTSYQTRSAISTEVLNRFPVSLSIALISLCVAAPLGIVIGIFTAVKQNTMWDYVGTTATVLFLSVPNFWIAIMLMLIVSLNLKLLPATGWGTWQHYILPCVTLAIHPVTHNSRLARTRMLEVIRQDYIRTAKSKGLNERQIVFKHALKNAAVPIITQVGTNLQVMVGSSAIVENIFGVPGLGSYIVYSIGVHDFPAVQGAILVFSLFVCLINLLVDIAYGFVDPRIRAKYTSSSRVARKANRDMAKTAKEGA